MGWDGVERRKENRDSVFCPAHIDLVSDMAVIKNSLKNIEKVITEGASFKNAVLIGFISMAVTIISSIVTFAFMFGNLNKQVEVNTERWNRLLENNPVVIDTRGIQK